MGCLQVKLGGRIEEGVIDADPDVDGTGKGGEHTCRHGSVLLGKPALRSGLASAPAKRHHTPDPFSNAPAGLHCSPACQVTLLLPPSSPYFLLMHQQSCIQLPQVQLDALADPPPRAFPAVHLHILQRPATSGPVHLHVLHCIISDHHRLSLVPMRLPLLHHLPSCCVTKVKLEQLPLPTQLLTASADSRDMCCGVLLQASPSQSYSPARMQPLIGYSSTMLVALLQVLPPARLVYLACTQPYLILVAPCCIAVLQAQESPLAPQQSTASSSPSGQLAVSTYLQPRQSACSPLQLCTPPPSQTFSQATSLAPSSLPPVLCRQPQQRRQP